jgi:uncharacterized membrane protein
MIRVALLLILLPCVGLADYPALHRVTGVASHDSLNIRAEPGVDHPVIDHLAHDATGIEVVDWNRGWGLVNTGEQSGWVNMRYLTPLDHPAWHSGDTGLTCFGTEPFWHLTSFLPSHRAEFQTPDNGGVELVVDAGALPATEFPRTLALPFSGAHDGMAVIRAQACNDGMSDRAFGLQVQVYFRGDRAGLSGCCSISAAPTR